MIDVNISIPFAIESNPVNDTLILRQEEWVGSVGKVLKIDLVRSMAETFYGEGNPSDIDCGKIDGSYVSGLFAYPSNIDMVYTPGVTHGTLGDRVDQYLEIRESVSFSLQDSKNVDYHILELISVEWYSDTWDGNGAVTSPPTITIEGNTLKLSKKVYGTAIVTYQAYRHAYSLVIPPRVSVENAYSSVAWANWDGGVVLLKLEPPPNAEEYLETENQCGWKGHIPPIPPGEPPPPEARPEDYSVRISYCDQQQHPGE